MVNRSGTQTRGDVLVNQLADGTDLSIIWDELTDALAEYNRHRSAIANLLSYKTVDAADAVPQDVHCVPTTSVIRSTGCGTLRWLNDVLGVPVRLNYIRTATAKGELTGVRMSGALFFSTSALFDWIMSRYDDANNGATA